MGSLNPAPMGHDGQPSATVHLGDCLDWLKTLPDASVGHIVTDPPYGQTNEAYESAIASDPELWSECYRVTGENAALISFAGSPTYHRIASAIEAGGWKVRQMWGWVYRNGFITSAYPTEGFDRLAPAFDPICFATKGKCLLPLEREPGPDWHRKRNATDKSGWSDRASGHGAAKASGRWPRNIVATDGLDGFQYFILNPNSPSLRAEKTGHPNQKPLALMRWLVSKLPNLGPILDPFAGSATTLEAAALEGFEAVGIERDPTYHAIATRRIHEALAKQREELFV